MFRILALLLIPFAVGLFFFWRRFVKRALKLFQVEGKKRTVLLWVLPAAGGLAMLGAFSAPGILYLYFFLLCALSGLIARFIKNPKGKKWLCSGLPALILTLLIGAYGFINMKTVRKTEYTVYTEKPPSRAYTVVLIADTHYGNSLKKADIEAVCARISALHPDVLLLGGDIVDESTPDGSVHEIFAQFGGVETTYGTFYVSGNHDRGTYRAGGGHDIEAALEGTGVIVLRDSSVPLGSELLLLGRRDAGDRARAPIAELLPGADAAEFCIVLDHQPKQYAENAAAGADLTLSGHTHAGQIFPAGFLTTVFGSELNYGRTERDGMTAIVTSGASGWGFPLRTSRHSEFVVITVIPK